MKAYCIWCETGSGIPKSGYYWIHMDCANKMMDIHNDIKAIRDILEERKTNRNLPIDKMDAVLEYIDRMERFDKKWKKTTKIINEATGQNLIKIPKQEVE